MSSVFFRAVVLTFMQFRKWRKKAAAIDAQNAAVFSLARAT
jgi:hypothetical protein